MDIGDEELGIRAATFLTAFLYLSTLPKMGSYALLQPDGHSPQ